MHVQDNLHDRSNLSGKGLLPLPPLPTPKDGTVSFIYSPSLDTIQRLEKREPQESKLHST